jgi:hypothetical protein
MSRGSRHQLDTFNQKSYKQKDGKTIYKSAPDMNNHQRFWLKIRRA